MTYDQLLLKFPNASLGFLAANASDGLPAHLAPQSAPAHEEAPRRGAKRTPGLSFADASAALERAQADHTAAAALVERDLWNGPLATGQDENRGAQKFLVRVINYRVRLQDEDNICEKFAVDNLRYSGILRNDDPSQARIITTQEKVRTRKEERVEITVEPITQ